MSNDCEWMTIKCNTESGINGSVDESEAMRFTRCECHFVVRSTTLGILVGTVDQDVVTSGWRASKSTIESSSAGLERCYIVPILKCVGAKIKIVVSSSRPIDLNSANNTVAVLSAEVRVVPCRSVFGSLELIRFGVTRSDST